MLIPVLLSGGVGSRLWPVSRAARPKQFLSLGGERSMLQETYRRLEGLDCAAALAQSRAFMVGRSAEAARELGRRRGVDDSASRQFEIPGNRSHSLLLMPSVSPGCLGALIAAYEHKTYFLAVLLGLNPFDQWGVELGKEIAGQLNGLLALGDTDAECDPATLKAAQDWRSANPD